MALRSTNRTGFVYSLRMLFVLVSVPCIGLGLLYSRHRYHYPHGREHCCDIGLALALGSYADTHAGTFPTGGATPEASLSLLYPKYSEPETLRGKTYPLEPAAKLLTAGLPLTPQTCGWHYVDGLSQLKGKNSALASKIALFWDKVGCGHNSERLPSGGHTVWFADCTSHQIVSEADWPRFFAEQERAVAELKQGKIPAAPWAPERDY